MHLSESRRQRGPTGTEAVSEHGLGCAGSSKASTSWDLPGGLASRLPDMAGSGEEGYVSGLGVCSRRFL